MKTCNAQKFVLLCGVFVFVCCGLYPPWLYTYSITGSGVGSEKDAGYHFILNPPLPERDSPLLGVKLDGERLLIEWGCVLAISGAAWGIFLIKTPAAKGASAAEEKANSTSSNQHDFKNDAKIYSALEIFKGQIEEEKSENPEEKPRMHHYNFAYKALPGLAFADPHVPLGFGDDTPKESLAKFWNYVGSKLPENERVSDAGLFAHDTPFGPDYVIVLVTMPTPLRVSEAYYIAIIYPRSWFKSPAYENTKPDLHVFILAKSAVPGAEGTSGGTLRILGKTGHGALQYGVPATVEAFLKEIQTAIQNPCKWITWVESKPWNYFMQDTETGETSGAA